ncbi:MAG: hypothetical protein [Olavius algarvensis Gamma 3 endosymbiont]|nr:MAG: hypothetical protein [Olavius algarvensis Gamma 3 endosymbiont]
MIRFMLRLLLVNCLWLVPLAAPAAVPANPLLVDDSIFVSQQGVYRFDLTSGKTLWSSLAGVETFEPVAFADLILVGSTQGLYALAAEDGRVVWRIEKSRTLFTPGISDQAYAGSVHGELYAIDPAHGRVNWRRQFPGWVYSPAVTSNSALLWTGGQAHRAYGLAAIDGSLRHEIPTTQETVFSPVDIGNSRVAFNLFDGSTLVIAAGSGKVLGSFTGNLQPNNLQYYRDMVYRSHRDGTLAAFDRVSLDLRWRKSLTAQDLILHPSQPGYLLASDRDRELILLDLAKNDAGCRMQIQGNWNLPIQTDFRTIVHFQKQMQPPGIRLVETKAICK